MAEGNENSFQGFKSSLANTLQSVTYKISILLLHHCQRKNVSYEMSK